MYTEVIKVGKNDKNEDNMGHADALTISMMHDSPKHYFAHQNSLFLLGLVFRCQ